MSNLCSKCFTSSWQPCEEGTANAIPDVVTGGFMVCGMCEASERIELLEKMLVSAAELSDFTDEELDLFGSILERRGRRK